MNLIPLFSSSMVRRSDNGSTPLPPSRGHKKRERTREQLLLSGLALLSKKGEDLTVSDVVSHAKVSNGTFYNYFSDREELLRALAERSLVDFTNETVHDSVTTDPALRIAITCARVLNRSRSDPDWGRIVLRLTELPRAVRNQVGKGLREELNDGYHQGRLSSPPDSITLDLVLGLISLSVRRLTHDDLPEDHIQKVIARGLLALGLRREDAEEIATQAHAIAQNPLPMPRVD